MERTYFLWAQRVIGLGVVVAVFTGMFIPKAYRLMALLSLPVGAVVGTTCSFVGLELPRGNSRVRATPAAATRDEPRKFSSGCAVENTDESVLHHLLDERPVGAPGVPACRPCSKQCLPQPRCVYRRHALHRSPRARGGVPRNEARVDRTATK